MVDLGVKIRRIGVLWRFWVEIEGKIGVLRWFWGESGENWGPMEVLG